MSRPRWHAVELAAYLALILGLVALAARGASAGEVVARLPVHRPCVVVVEREPDGTIRIAVEIPPNPNPAPRPTPTPPPADPMEAEVAAAVAAIPDASRAVVLEALAAEVERAYAAGLADEATAVGVVVARTLARLGEAGPALAGAVDRLARSIGRAPGGLAVPDRLALLAALVARHRGQIR